MSVFHVAPVALAWLWSEILPSQQAGCRLVTRANGRGNGAWRNAVGTAENFRPSATMLEPARHGPGDADSRRMPVTTATTQAGLQAGDREAGGQRARIDDRRMPARAVRNDREALRREVGKAVHAASMRCALARRMTPTRRHTHPRICGDRQSLLPTRKHAQGLACRDLAGRSQPREWRPLNRVRGTTKARSAAVLPAEGRERR